jgi:hypothetical protein
MVGDQGFELVCKCAQSARQWRGRVGADLPVGDVAKAVAVSLDQPPAGGAEARIESEDFQARRSSSSSGTS